MFTGIIESLGKITDLKVDRGNIDFTIESDISKELKVDQSVSHNGVCLTVTDTNNNTHTVTAVKETLDKSSLTNFSVNDLVNLERAMKLGERLDGHLVQGHVDGVAKCLGISVNDGSWIYKFEFDISNEMLLIEKGSICINGVSLTQAQMQYHREGEHHIQKRSLKNQIVFLANVLLPSIENNSLNVIANLSSFAT